MNGEHIRHAREFNGWTQAELAERLGVDQSAVAHLERGDFRPSAGLRERIPQALGFPPAFFERETVFSLPEGSLIYRRKARLAASELTRSYRLAWQACHVWRALSDRAGAPAEILPKRLNEDAETAARIVRSLLGRAPHSPVRNLINRLEQAGALIFMLPATFEGLDGFSALIDGRRPAIFLSDGKPGDRQALTTAHELGHCLLHVGASLGDAEEEAYRFAGELLFPKEAAREEITRPVTLSKLADLKDRWGLSIQALIKHAFVLGIITARQRTHLYSQLRRRWGLKVEPRPVAPERPRLLGKMAEDACGGSIDLRLLAEICSLTPFQVKQVLGPYARKEDLGADSGAPGTLVSFTGA